MSREGVMASVMSILLIALGRLEDAGVPGEGGCCGYRDRSLAKARGFDSTSARGSIQPSQADAA